MPKNNGGSTDRACFKCLLWWFARKEVERASHEAGSRDGYAELGKMAGYSRWMSGRRAQEVRELSLSEYIEREWVSVVGPMVDPERE